MLAINEKLNMHSKFGRTNKKSGFTLVELVIVIALLAILAAIAIPVITSTINSGKMSVMESDCQTADLLIKTALTELDNEVFPTTYNGTTVNPDTTVEDIFIENSIDDFEFSRTIAGTTYYMVWENGGLKISTSPTGGITTATTLSALSTT